MKSSRNYPLLLVSQFLGALGDNAILAVILGQLTLLQKTGALSLEDLRTRSALYTSLLFFPYVFLAPMAGFLNDRFAKTSSLLGGNFLKVVGTLFCALSLWHGSLWQAPGYLIVGIGATLYGPAKYGILPEILPRERLVKANGMVELLTLLAILSGAIAGAWMVDRLPVSTCYGILLALFSASMGLNLLMVRTASNPQVRLQSGIREFTSHLGSLFRSGNRLGRILVGTTLFWISGAAMKINFQAWGLEVLSLPNNTQIALLGLWLSVGVMAGSMLAGMLYPVGDLRHLRRHGFFLAALLFLVFLVAPLNLGQLGRYVLQTVHPDGQVTVSLVLLPAVMAILVGAGVAAGLFLIPLNAALQAESDPLKLGKTIAIQNFCDNLGMILASGIVLGCNRGGLSSSQVFLVLSLLVFVAVLGLRMPNRIERSEATV